MSAILLVSTPPSLIKKERYYAADTYLLPSDDVERDRLKMQHDMLMKHTEEVLPSALLLQEGDSILDAGTGSGVWLLDVAKTVPTTVSLTGVDIESRLFPLSQPNTKFLVRSSLDLPTEWSSTFALVHQRLMVAAFSHEAWTRCISGFFRVLKPGGWIRLEEIDFLGVFNGCLPVPPLTARFWRGAKLLCQARDIATDDLLKISEMLSEAGFEDVKMTKTLIQLGGEANKDARLSGIGAWKGMKGPFLKAGGMGVARTSEDYDMFMDKVDQEWHNVNFARTWVTWTARKPL